MFPPPQNKMAKKLNTQVLPYSNNTPVLLKSESESSSVLQLLLPLGCLESEVGVGVTK